MFSRLGWTDGHNETWTFTDADWSASLGVSVKGEAWRRPDDTFGLAGIVSGASPITKNSWRQAARTCSTATAR